jgi:hypothetical protein
VRSGRRWDTPIRRNGEEPPPPPAPAIGDKPTFEQAVEQWLEEHVSTKTGRPYGPTTKTVARYNLLGGRLTAWREARGIGNAEEWTASVAAEYLDWYQHDIGADSDTIKKFRTQLRQFAAFCARTFDNREAGQGVCPDAGRGEHAPAESVPSAGLTDRGDAALHGHKT